MLAIAKREFKAFFSSPIGYVCVAVILALYGFFYYQALSFHSTDYLTNVFSTMTGYSLFIIPLITMRSFSEDRKNKTDQALLTAPVNVSAIVMGKFLACFSVYFIAMTMTLVPVVLMSTFSTPPWGVVIGNYIASLLCGAAMMSIGIYISSLTTSQIIAAVGTLVVAILLTMIDTIGSAVSVEFVQKIITWISFNARYYTFTQGVFDVPGVVYFVSLCGVFVFLTARKVESRRWN